jgi:hypothetical protein
VGNVAVSTIDTGPLTINGGSDVTIGALTAANNAFIRGAGSSLQVTNDYEQTGGRFSVFGDGVVDVAGTFFSDVEMTAADPGTMLRVAGDFQQTAGAFEVHGTAGFEVDGSFQYAGNDFRVVNASFNVGNVAASSVDAGLLTINGGAGVAVGSMSAAERPWSR